jgi:hypothetical protein
LAEVATVSGDELGKVGEVATFSGEEMQKWGRIGWIIDHEKIK